MVRQPKHPEIIRQYWRVIQRRYRERQKKSIFEIEDERERQKKSERIVFDHLRKCPECRRKVWNIFVVCITKSLLDKVPLPDGQKELIENNLLEEIIEVQSKIGKEIVNP